MLGVWDNHGGHLGLPLVMKLLSHPIAYSKSPLYVCTWTTHAGSGPRLLEKCTWARGTKCRDPDSSANRPMLHGCHPETLCILGGVFLNSRLCGMAG